MVEVLETSFIAWNHTNTPGFWQQVGGVNVQTKDNFPSEEDQCFAAEQGRCPCAAKERERRRRR